MASSKQYEFFDQVSFSHWVCNAGGLSLLRREAARVLGGLTKWHVQQVHHRVCDAASCIRWLMSMTLMRWADKLTVVPRFLNERAR
jgi:hypothetical protein